MTTLLDRIFAERKQSSSLDLEAVEMAFRAALHQAGAAALTQLLQFPEPAGDQYVLPCSCGHQARYQRTALAAHSHRPRRGGTDAPLVSVSTLS